MDRNYADDEAPFAGDPADPGELPPPNPGSDAAVKAGCTCAVLDNGRGDAKLAEARGGFWITAGCPLHAPVHGPLNRRDDIRDEDEGRDWT
jgi:hypothetical protein